LALNQTILSQTKQFPAASVRLWARYLVPLLELFNCGDFAANHRPHIQIPLFEWLRRGPDSHAYGMGRG